MMNSTLIDDPDFAPGGSPQAKGINPLIQAELADGERLIWVGRPRWNPTSSWLPMSVRVLCGVIGGLMGLLGSVLVLGGLLNRSNVMNGPLICGCGLVGPSLFILWVGFRGLIGPFGGGDGNHAPIDPLRAWLNRRVRDTHHALTDRRVILWEPAPFGTVRVRSLRARDLMGISRTQRPDGSGDLHLEIMAPMATGQVGLVALGTLRRIDKVREVEAMIRSTLFQD